MREEIVSVEILFSGSSRSSQSFDFILTFLQNNPQIKVLKYADSLLRVPDIVKLFDVLHACPNLQEFSLRCAGMGELGSKACGKLLAAEGCPITKLQLYNSRVLRHNQDIKNICFSLKNNKKITEIKYYGKLEWDALSYILIIILSPNNVCTTLHINFDTIRSNQINGVMRAQYKHYKLYNKNDNKEVDLQVLDQSESTEINIRTIIRHLNYIDAQRIDDVINATDALDGYVSQNALAMSIALTRKERAPDELPTMERYAVEKVNPMAECLINNSGALGYLMTETQLIDDNDDTESDPLC